MKARQLWFRTALGICILLFAMAAMAGPIPLSNPYVSTAVSNYGTLGSGGSTSPGLLYDPTGNSNYGNNDILTPGDPFEGFYVSYNGILSTGNNNDGSSAAFGVHSPTVSGNTVTWTGSNGALSITNTYTLNGQTINIDTTLYALTNLSNVEFLRTLDPDPDVNMYGSYSTNNVLVNNDEVVASGQYSGQTVGLYSDSSIAHSAGVSYWSTIPGQYLEGTNVGDGDNTIGMAFNVGNMEQGSSVDLDYEYFVGATPNANSPVHVPTTTPECGSMTLLISGLLGFLTLKRRNMSL